MANISSRHREHPTRSRERAIGEPQPLIERGGRRCVGEARVHKTIDQDVVAPSERWARGGADAVAHIPPEVHDAVGFLILIRGRELIADEQIIERLQRRPGDRIESHERDPRTVKRWNKQVDDLLHFRRDVRDRREVATRHRLRLRHDGIDSARDAEQQATLGPNRRVPGVRRVQQPRLTGLHDEVSRRRADLERAVHRIGPFDVDIAERHRNIERVEELEDDDLEEEVPVVRHGPVCAGHPPIDVDHAPDAVGVALHLDDPVARPHRGIPAVLSGFRIVRDVIRVRAGRAAANKRIPSRRIPVRVEVEHLRQEGLRLHAVDDHGLAGAGLARGGEHALVGAGGAENSIGVEHGDRVLERCAADRAVPPGSDNQVCQRVLGVHGVSLGFRCEPHHGRRWFVAALGVGRRVGVGHAVAVVVDREHRRGAVVFHAEQGTGIGDAVVVEIDERRIGRVAEVDGHVRRNADRHLGAVVPVEQRAGVIAERAADRGVHIRPGRAVLELFEVRRERAEVDLEAVLHERDAGVVLHIADRGPGLPLALVGAAAEHELIDAEPPLLLAEREQAGGIGRDRADRPSAADRRQQRADVELRPGAAVEFLTRQCRVCCGRHFDADLGFERPIGSQQAAGACVAVFAERKGLLER